MYATHFDLDRRLFAPGIAQDDARFVDERDADAGLPAAVALSSPDSVLVLLGPPGVGKTAFAAHALRTSTGGMRCAVAWLATPPATPHELLELLLAEFGFEPYRQSRAERVQTWRQFLMELGATETRVFVALERAHDFDTSVLSALDALTTPDPNACPGASLVLMGSEEFATRLEEPALEPLRQRVRLVRRLSPLDSAGVGAYLRHAVRRAGGEIDRLFSAQAVAALARASGGIPRVVNHLAESALALAALRGASVVDDDLVSSVAAQRAGTVLSSASPEPSEAPSPRQDDIPVLTELVDGEAEGGTHPDALDELDTAATMTLLDDDLDDISGEFAAEVFAVDGADRARGVASDAHDSVEGAAPAQAAGKVECVAADTSGVVLDEGRRRARPRRRAAG